MYPWNIFPRPSSIVLHGPHCPLPILIKYPEKTYVLSYTGYFITIVVPYCPLPHSDQKFRNNLCTLIHGVFHNYCPPPPVPSPPEGSFSMVGAYTPLWLGGGHLMHWFSYPLLLLLSVCWLSILLKIRFFSKTSIHALTYVNISSTFSLPELTVGRSKESYSPETSRIASHDPLNVFTN